MTIPAFEVMTLEEDVTYQDLCEQYPEGIARVKTVKGYAYFKTLSAPDFDRYLTDMLDENARSGASRLACQLAVVSPEPAVFGAWCKAKPGIPMTCINRVMELAGYDASGKD